LKLYDVSITYLPANGDKALLAGRCIKVLHGFMSRNEKFNIAVSFPRWNQKDIGRQIAFVSPDSDLLGRLLEQKYFQMMIENGLFEVSSITELEESNRYVKFVRNQAIDKMTPAAKARRLKRVQKRALARGELFEPVAPKSKEVDFFHSIPMESSTSQMNYMLRVQRYELDSVDDSESFEVCSYGLSTKTNREALIPFF